MSDELKFATEFNEELKKQLNYEYDSYVYAAGKWLHIDLTFEEAGRINMQFENDAFKAAYIVNKQNNESYLQYCVREIVESIEVFNNSENN